jgi:putative transposase
MRGPFTQLYCHLVWATWDRMPLIPSHVEPRLYGAIESKARELRCTPIALGGTENHVHVLCCFPPTIEISYLIQQIKGASSHLMTHAIPGMESFKWQGAYGAFTVGHREIEIVQAYVQDQKRRHAVEDTWDELEHCQIPEPCQAGKSFGD